MREAKRFDAATGQLAFYRRAATADFWDDHWENIAARAQYTKPPRRGTFVTKITQRHLSRGARVLEGGCGLAVNSWHLRALGYDAVPLDFASRTIAFLDEKAPELHAIQGDVRALPFEDASFDGYWSLGVIEHFPEGYDAIADEMHRVLKIGGKLFLTFPYMSPMRKALARAGFFRREDGSSSDGDFFQFALDHEKVAKSFERRGFRVVDVVPHLGLSGLEDTFPVLERPLARVRKGPRPVRAVAGLVNRGLEPLTSHVVLLVLERTR